MVLSLSKLGTYEKIKNLFHIFEKVGQLSKGFFSELSQFFIASDLAQQL